MGLSLQSVESGANLGEVVSELIRRWPPLGVRSTGELVAGVGDTAGRRGAEGCEKPEDLGESQAMVGAPGNC